MNPRLIGVAATALLALGGGSRLIYNEVRLASAVGITPAQERYRQDEATRASRLAIELAAAQGSISALETAVAAAESQAQGAERRVQTLTAELETARADFGATLSQRSARIAGLESELGRAEAEQREAAEALAARERELGAARETLSSLEAERERLRRLTEELDRQAKFLAQELTQREEALQASAEARDAVQQDLARTREHLDATQTELATALKRAGDTEAVLAALRDAGVDVARLSGADPMPMVRGFVVRVDTSSVPPVVLVHVGARSGLRAGDQLYVVRRGRRVATLEVDALQEDICTTRIVAGGRGLQLAPRDEVFSWEPER
ncbi:MAG: hypothetical protein KDD82_13730 [Planctomycetes bacterium]|nr:hypothetical protein [Planctomycetota bacterium]